MAQTETGSGSGTQNVDPTTKQITITGTDITTSAILKLEAVYNSTTYERSETIADIDDGVSPIIEYSTDAITTPPASVDNWTSDSENANWMRISIDGGATYGGAILVKGESGTKQAGLTLFIYKNIENGVDAVPSAPTVPATGSLIPSGWTDGPTAFIGSHDVTYMTSCNFVLVSDGDTSILTRTHWTPLTANYGTPIRITGVDGEASGIAGPIGEKGWSPVFALIADGSRQILELVDWTGGEGTKPSYGGLYVGTTGLVSTKAAAVNLKGDPGIITPVSGVPYSNNTGRTRSFVCGWNGTVEVRSTTDSTVSLRVSKDGGNNFTTIATLTQSKDNNTGNTDINLGGGIIRSHNHDSGDMIISGSMHYAGILLNGEALDVEFPSGGNSYVIIN